eukprot:m.181369 g.181369  ORF g.181369 m.181369 type:complete len:420 (+) comp15241_c0_seq1:69-1328(+)
MCSVSIPSPRTRTHGRVPGCVGANVPHMVSPVTPSILGWDDATMHTVAFYFRTGQDDDAQGGDTPREASQPVTLSSEASLIGLLCLKSALLGLASETRDPFWRTIYGDTLDFLEDPKVQEALLHGLQVWARDIVPGGVHWTRDPPHLGLAALKMCFRSVDGSPSAIPVQVNSIFHTEPNRVAALSHRLIEPLTHRDAASFAIQLLMDTEVPEDGDWTHAQAAKGFLSKFEPLDRSKLHQAEVFPACVLAQLLDKLIVTVAPNDEEHLIVLDASDKTKLFGRVFEMGRRDPGYTDLTDHVTSTLITIIHDRLEAKHPALDCTLYVAVPATWSFFVADHEGDSVGVMTVTLQKAAESMPLARSGRTQVGDKVSLENAHGVGTTEPTEQHRGTGSCPDAGSGTKHAQDHGDPSARSGKRART